MNTAPDLLPGNMPRMLLLISTPDMVVVTGVDIGVDIGVVVDTGAGAGVTRATVMATVMDMATGVVTGVATGVDIIHITHIMDLPPMEKEIRITQVDTATTIAITDHRQQEMIDIALPPWEDRHRDLMTGLVQRDQLPAI